MVTDLVFTKQIPPQYIINVDETPFGVPMASPYVVSPINSPQRPVIAKEPRHINVTITLTVSLAGLPLPTQVVWPTLTPMKEFFVFNPSQIVVTYNGTGYQDKTSFYTYMCETILPILISMRERAGDNGYPIVVFLDGHKSRNDERFRQFCQTHYILPILFPPHTSHLLQVLDQNLNGALKEHLRIFMQRFNTFISNPKDTSIPFGFPDCSGLQAEQLYRKKFAYILPLALQNTLTASGIHNAWMQAGLYNKECMEAKIASLPLSPDSTTSSFNKSDYLLLELPPPRPTAVTQPKQQANKQTTQKREKKPTSKPKPPRERPSIKQVSAEKLGVSRGGRPIKMYDYAALNGLTSSKRKTKKHTHS